VQEKKWLVAICAGWQQVHSIKTARDLGISVIAFDGDANAPGKDYADLFFAIDVTEPELIVKKISDLGIEIKCAVSFISDIGMLTAGIVNDFFGTGAISERVALGFTNKKSQREALGLVGLYNPKWVSVMPDDEWSALSILESFKGSIVVKPTDSAGSKGITKLEFPYTDIVSAVKKGREHSNEIIIEEFIVGREFSIETFWVNGCCDVLAISRRIIEKDKTASSIERVKLPARLENCVIEAVKRINIDLGIHSGPAHTELIVNSKNEIFILETAARGGGFFVFDAFIPKITGKNYTIDHLNLLMGLPPAPVTDSKTDIMALLKYLPSRAGVIASVTGFESLENIEGVTGESFVVAGDMTSESEVDADRLGYILVSGQRGTDLQQMLYEATALIKVVYQ